MYELLVLGALVRHDRTGYKIKIMLENNLVPRRPISNGVLYPLLAKLQATGSIDLTDVDVNGRHQKMAHITARGREHLHELMMLPVPIDAKWESVYQLKLMNFEIITPAERLQILDEYLRVTKADQEIYENVIGHIERDHGSLVRADGSDEFGLRTVKLRLQINAAKLNWINEQIKQNQEN